MIASEAVDRRLRIAAGVALALLIVFVLVATLSSSVDLPRSRALRVVRDAVGVGAPAGEPQLVEHPDVASNILLFIPVGLLGAIAFPRRKRWVLVAAAGASAVIEASQGWFLDERVASLRDLASNAVGALIGVAAAAALIAVAGAWTRRRAGPY